MSQTEVTRADSIQEEDPHNEPPKKQKNRRPANTAFRQQRLKAWQPILTPKTVLPIFFAIGIVFAPIGGLLLWASYSIQELVIDYSDCNATATTEFTQIPDSKVSSSFKTSNNTVRPQWRKTLNTTTPPLSVEIEDTAVCTLQFSIPNDIGPPVYLYYRLTNFYQNHRRYVKSLNTEQLKGHALSNGTIDGSSCNPLKLDDNGKAYYPCGLIANSIFNDTLNSPVAVNAPGSQGSQQYRMTNKGIAWGSDASLYRKTKYTNHQVSPPPNWQKRYPNGYTDEHPIPDLSQYEEFHVWMRTAGLPTFSKLALRNDNETMTAGIYQMDIYDFFPVNVYDGTKSVLISTRSVVGGKNSFLGIAYVVVGGLCIVLGVLFTVAHLIRPRKMGDHTYLSWNNDTPATASIPSSFGDVPKYRPPGLPHPTYVTDAVVTNPFIYLVHVYTNASINYCVCAANGDEPRPEARSTPRHLFLLNISYQSVLRSGPGTPKMPPSLTFLGLCTLPTSSVRTSTLGDSYVTDRCNVLSAISLGGNIAGYNLGVATAYEVSYWNAILHTLNRNGCDPFDSGDYAADPPQEMTSTSESK
ncbi:uncharacterized protein Z518_00190 [Rhinocladiella mackenziei CBS 650.93]|uniref:LEM3/CDC50 family protein n=1 Tax=Rhinocladiella mackenziei CBS 650.93 TaxID=1442369 RepID=A0A0D2G3G6_9EURO|nr:uncharacterized protein Z518_00190 [Rhinocladiella mackenziei CBS 650.93]KIX09112.1 hypothetical protein Z518_00190 [Rhinocladiella mackenziei CBS 650.93]